MQRQPLVDVCFHDNVICCTFLSSQLSDRSDLRLIFVYLYQCAQTHPGITMILDLKKVDYISSLFLKYLMQLLKQTNLNKGNIVLAQVNDSVFEILELTQMDKKLSIHRVLDHENNPVTRLIERCGYDPDSHSTILGHFKSIVHHIHLPNLLHHRAAQTPLR